jgi:hypothetical protein
MISFLDKEAQNAQPFGRHYGMKKLNTANKSAIMAWQVTKTAQSYQIFGMVRQLIRVRYKTEKMFNFKYLEK